MAGVLEVVIVSRAGGQAWAGQASQVSVPLESGELGVLPGREPVLALLGTGSVRVTSVDGEAVSVPVSKGFCSVDHNVVTVAADAAGDEVSSTRMSEG